MDGIISRMSDLDCEAAVLGAVLLENELMRHCLDSLLEEKDFSNEYYKALFQTMKHIYINNEPIELVSIKTEFDKISIKFDFKDIADMTSRAIPGNIDFYIKRLKDLSYKRNAYVQTKKFLDNIESLDPSEIKEKIQLLQNTVDMSSTIDSFICEASEIKRKDLSGGLETGFSELDSIMNGIVFGSLTILTGEPSSGKSTILNQIIAQNIKNNNRVMIYSGELTGFNVLSWFMRTVANANDLAEFKGRHGIYYDVTNYGEEKIRKWIKDKFYIFNEDSIPTIDNICNSIEFLVRTKNIKLAVLDNMMTIENSGTEELEKQKNLAKRLKAIARKYDICIILVAHPKKKLQGDKKYHMHDVSGASEVVNLADYELLLTREITLTGGERKDETFIAVMKNRITGKQGIRKKLYFDEMRKRFFTNKEELTRDYEYYIEEQTSFIELDEVFDVPF